jgi:GLPGLI family protein
MRNLCGIKYNKYCLNVILLSLVFCVNLNYTLAQHTEGRIVFERRTNLEKKFKDQKFGRKEINEDNKIKIEFFELLFKDSLGVFKPIENNAQDDFAWATMRNSCFYNIQNSNKLLLMNVMGKDLFVTDSLNKIQWKVTESTRKIAGLDCYRSVWDKNDSTRIYAWFTIDIPVSMGPEGIEGLPGMILGLATEDGSIIYFAKEVRFINVNHDSLVYSDKIKEVYTKQQLNDKFSKEASSSPFAKRIFDEIFRWF